MSFASGTEDWYTFKSLPEVSARNIRERHLVSYTPELLLPLVLANCNYSLTVGQFATLDYDFETFQKQLQDSVLGCKSRVSRHQSGHIEVSGCMLLVGMHDLGSIDKCMELSIWDSLIMIARSTCLHTPMCGHANKHKRMHARTHARTHIQIHEHTHT